MGIRFPKSSSSARTVDFTSQYCQPGDTWPWRDIKDPHQRNRYVRAGNFLKGVGPVASGSHGGLGTYSSWTAEYVYIKMCLGPGDITNEASITNKV